MDVIEWLLDGDPAIRWQVLRDLTDASPERGRARAGAGGARGLGRPAARGRGRRRAVGGRRVLPGRLHARAAKPGQPWTSTMHTLQTLQLLGLDPDVGVGPPRDRARRRERTLGARRSALLRRRGRAVHQRPDDRDRRLLRRGRRADRRAACSASGSTTAAGTARPRTGRCDRRSTRRSTCSTVCSSSSERPVVSDEVQRRAPSGEEYLLERSLFRRKSTGEVVDGRPTSTSRSPTTGTTTCCARSTTSAAPAPSPIPAWPRRSRWCGRSGSPTAAGCSTASTRAESTSTSRTVGTPSRWNTLRALRVLRLVGRQLTSQLFAFTFALRIRLIAALGTFWSNLIWNVSLRTL